MPVKNKGGAPLGNRNAAGQRGLAGLPPQMVTNQLIKSLKQYERVSDDDPKKNVKKGQAIRKITDQIVEAAVGGDKWAIEYVTERIEGKAVNRTETAVQVGGQVEHKGLQITFEKPVQGEVIEHERLLPE